MLRHETPPTPALVRSAPLPLGGAAEARRRASRQPDAGGHRPPSLPEGTRPVIALALIGLIALPIIVAFYMLRLRRRDVPVGSTFLWQQLIRDVEANAPWQRLRFSWLLLVQLLIAAIVVAAAARPFSTVESDLAANVVLIVDTSASMATSTDDEDRMALARERARDVVERLPVGGRITVVAAADTANVLVSETDDTAAALEAIDGITATQLPGDLTDAFALSSALAQRDADSTVVVVTDAAGDELPDVGVGAPVLVERIGATDANQAIAALSALRSAGGAQLDLFVAVSNPSSVEATRRLEVYADGELVDARELTIPPGQRSEALVSTVPASATVVEARLAGSDALLTDDRAFAVVPADETTRTLLVGAGNAYLENALALLPRLELYAVDADGYEDAVADAEEAGTPYGFLVFDGVVPDDPPELPALYLDPDADGSFGTVEGRVENPAIDRADPDEPAPALRRSHYRPHRSSSRAVAGRRHARRGRDATRQSTGRRWRGRRPPGRAHRLRPR